MTKETNAITPKKIAIVTGGSRGIGRSTVESLAKHGVNTIFTYHTHGTEAEAVVRAVNEAGSEAVALQLDAGAVASFDAVTTRWPFGLNCAALTSLSCFIGSPSGWPLAESQSRTVPSDDAVTRSVDASTASNRGWPRGPSSGGCSRTSWSRNDSRACPPPASRLTD